MGFFNFGVRLSKEDRKLLNDIKDLLVNGLEGKKVVVTISVEDKVTHSVSGFNVNDSDGN